MIEALTYDDVQIIPAYSEIASRSSIDLTTKLTRNFKIYTPFISAPMDSVTGVEMCKVLYDLGAVGALHRFCEITDQSQMARDIVTHIRQAHPHENKIPPVVASIGVGDQEKHRIDWLLAAGVNVFLIDVAHGDHKNVKDMLDYLNKFRERRQFDVIAGNIATKAAAVRLQDWGADALRVGIGGGSMCTTRIRTGVGVPQLTAILEVCEVSEVPVIADGGIRNSGDAAKALAAGASTVMLGGLLSGTDEAPGDVFVTGDWPNEKKMKVYRGSASMAIKLETKGKAGNVEGTATMVPLKGKAEKVITIMSEGIQSAMSYVGAINLNEFAMKANFCKITSAGHIEATPHGLK